MAVGMKTLILAGVTSLNQGLRMNDKGCAAYYMLLYGDSGTRRKTESREEFEFLAALSTTVPLLENSDDDLKDRFSRCEEKSLAPEDGDPLLFCVLTDGIAVGFPSEKTWDCDQITVIFDELLPDDVIVESSETIDNLTRSSHASNIHERHMTRLRHLIDPVAFWNARQEAFQNLEFVPEVGVQLVNLNSTAWGKIVTAFNRMEIGNLSNVKSVGEGVLEFRIHFGQGYRIYFGGVSGTLVILGCGTKQSQNHDIIEARRRWAEFKEL